MKNAEAFLTDTLNRLKRSIEITGTGLNFKGRKAIEYPVFEKRFLRKICFTGGTDKYGYYGVQLTFEVDGSEFIFDTALRRAMVWDINRKTGEKSPVIYDILDDKMIRFLNVHYKATFGDFLSSQEKSPVYWTDYTKAA